MLTPPERKPLWKQYLDKYKDPIIQILLVAAVVSLLLALKDGSLVETIGIFAAIILATTLGFWFEVDADKKFDLLAQMDEEQPVKVIRGGAVKEIPRGDVVVDDIILLEVGDEVPADAELMEAIGLEVDESTLTGEPICQKYVITDRSHDPTHEHSTYPAWNVMRSSMVMSGRGIARVTATGDATEIGKVARKATEHTGVQTPLNRQLTRLGKIISRLGIGISVAIFIAFVARDVMLDPDGVWAARDAWGIAGNVLNYFMMAVTLIVMAVPEGLPMAITLSLALNMRRMLKTNNLVRHLDASETMGAVTVICTDKTGTLTQNRMTVHEIQHPFGTEFFEEAIALNTTAHLDGDNGIGNPTEVALLRWLRDNGRDYRAIRQSISIVSQEPFSSDRKYMKTVAEIDGTRYEFIKGAPEILMPMCDLLPLEKGAIEGSLKRFQNQAMRTLGFVCNGKWQGLAAISDPLREDVPEAVKQCQSAGIGVKVVTGDTEDTAIEVARQIGVWPKDADEDKPMRGQWHISGEDFAALNDDEAYNRVKSLLVVSRARPADKQRLVSLLQQHGEIVAVTGDGTNDAPALNHAHVGLSLGSGTSVAKQASDITLIDDSFKSIVKAVMWGRSLYKNIQRFLWFQLVVNVTALLLCLTGAAVGTQMPLTVTQILWVNIIMDTFAAMALSTIPSSPEVMREKPRNQEDFIISRPMLKGILTTGLCFFLVMFIMLLQDFHGAETADIESLTIFFTVFVMIQWWNLFNARTLGGHESALKGLWKDKGLLVVLGAILAGQWLIVTFGGDMFRTTPLSFTTWLSIIVATAPVLMLGEAWRTRERLKEED